MSFLGRLRVPLGGGSLALGAEWRFFWACKRFHFLFGSGLLHRDAYGMGGYPTACYISATLWLLALHINFSRGETSFLREAVRMDAGCLDTREKKPVIHPTRADLSRRISTGSAYSIVCAKHRTSFSQMCGRCNSQPLTQEWQTWPVVPSFNFHFKPCCTRLMQFWVWSFSQGESLTVWGVRAQGKKHTYDVTETQQQAFIVRGWTVSPSGSYLASEYFFTSPGFFYWVSNALSKVIALMSFPLPCLEVSPSNLKWPVLHLAYCLEGVHPGPTSLV